MEKAKYATMKRSTMSHLPKCNSVIGEFRIEIGDGTGTASAEVADVSFLASFWDGRRACTIAEPT
jgi:hypothetical protein